MKRCSDPKYELVFLQVAHVLRKLLEKRVVNDTFVDSSELKTASNNSSLLSDFCYRQDLKG